MESPNVIKIPDVKIDSELYTIYSVDYVDQVFYHVVKDGEELCVISMNDEGRNLLS